MESLFVCILDWHMMDSLFMLLLSVIWVVFIGGSDLVLIR
jgi:hypothetical protein